MQPPCDRDVPPGERAAIAGERLRVGYELGLGGERGTCSRGVAKVTAGRPAGEMEVGATDGRIEGENRQVGGGCP
jgi:hypothetical protein